MSHRCIGLCFVDCTRHRGGSSRGFWGVVEGDQTKISPGDVGARVLFSTLHLAAGGIICTYIHIVRTFSSYMYVYIGHIGRTGQVGGDCERHSTVDHSASPTYALGCRHSARRSSSCTLTFLLTQKQQSGSPHMFVTVSYIHHTQPPTTPSRRQLTLIFSCTL